MAMPPGSSRGLQSRAGMGSSYGPAVGAALNTQITPSARPASSQGIKVMPSSYKNRDRQVKDRTYYIAKLREKNSALQAEVERLTQKRDTLERGQAGRAELEGKRAAAEKEVEQLLVQVSAYNFAIDAAAKGLDVAKIEKQAVEAEKEASRLSNAVDDVYRERVQKQAKVDELTTKLETTESEIAARVEKEAPVKVDEFMRLRDKLRGLINEVEPLQTQLDRLSRSVAEKQAKLKSSQAKVAAMQLRERKAELEREKSRMLDEIAANDGMLLDEKTRLFQKVQADTRELEAKQKMVEAKKAEIERTRDQTKQLERTLAEYTDENAQKFRKLEARDREMTDFVDRFDETKENELAEIAKAEEMIIDLLEHISKNIVAKDNLPDASKLQTMEDDLKFKQQQADLAETTYERLVKERQMRLTELQRVEGLATKIETETAQLTELLEKEEKELAVYSDLDGLRQSFEKKRQLALNRKKAYVTDQEQVRQQISQLTGGPFDTLQKSLKGSKVFSELRTLEEAVRAKRRVEFEMRDFLHQKAVETDYSVLKTECLRLTASLNERLKEIQMSAPRSTTLSQG